MPIPGNAAYFIIKEHGQKLTDTNVLANISVYYFNANGRKIASPNDMNGSKIYDYNSFLTLIREFYTTEVDSGRMGMMILSPLISNASQSEGIHDFYVAFPNGDIDTIKMVAENVSCEQGWQEECKCTVPIRILKYNGRDAVKDYSYNLSNGQPVFIFEK